MDEMKIVSSFTRKLVAKAVSKVIKKKLGYDVSLVLNNLYVTVDDDGNVAHIHVDANADIQKSDLEAIVENI